MIHNFCPRINIPPSAAYVVHDGPCYAKWLPCASFVLIVGASKCCFSSYIHADCVTSARHSRATVMATPAFEKVPEPQLEQLVARPAEKVPSAQGVGVEDTEAHDEPGGHSLHT